MAKPTIRDLWVLLIIGGCLVAAGLNYTNGDLWPGSIFLSLSAVAMAASWVGEKRRFSLRAVLIARWLPTTEGSVRRRSIYITYNGTRLNINGWARRLGISHPAMNKRIQRCKGYGAPLSEALTTPAGEFMPTAFERLKRPN